MRLIQRPTNDSVQFVISDAPAKYHDAIRGLAFGESADGFVKELPRQTPYLDTAFARFEQHLETIIQQAAHEIPVPWEKAFERFLQRVHSIEADWWVTGSLALVLRGLPVQPGDIDLIVDGEGALRWGEVLADIMIEPVISTDWFCKYWGRAFDHARIEWVGEIDIQSDTLYVRDYYLSAVNNLKLIDWNNFSVRVSPVEPLLRMDEARGRHERVKLVRQALNRDTTTVRGHAGENTHP